MKAFTQQIISELWPVVKKPLLLSLIAFVAFLILIPVFTYVYFAGSLQSKESIMNQNDAGVTLLDRNNQPFFSFYSAKQKKIVPLSDISTPLQQAVVASEDKDFYNHRGFSIRGIARAFVADITHQGLQQGGSTITQQLVKNALLNQRKSFLRKYQEIVLAQEIERRYKKNEILEMYLNSVYFGEGAFGAEQASLTYFDKHAKDLSLAESSFLVAILPAPSALSPFSGDLEQAKVRETRVLDEMQQQNYINSQQKAQAEKVKLTFNQQPEVLNAVAPHFALMVKQELIDKYGEEYVARSGLKVKTSLDLNWQKYAETTVKTQVERLKYNRASNGAAIAIDPQNGQVKALVGSADWYNTEFGKFNIAIANRQPGSSFKPIVYSEALDKRVITAATILKDEPTTFPGGYKPKNYDGKYRGDVTVRRALSNSLNIPSVKVIQKLGVENALQAAKRMGISNLSDDPNNYGFSLVLGAADVKLIDMTNAYAAFANGGVNFKPTFILEIKDKLNNTIFKATPNANRATSPEASFIISSILSDNKTRSEVFGNALTISRTAAVKTGTTENYRDALTIGYTPQVVVGVWVGNNDNTAMDNVAGSLGAAPIWRLLMEHYLTGMPVVNFKQPLGIREVTLCTTKTEKDGDKEKTTTTTNKEYFIAGTEPTDTCITPTPDQSPTPSPGPTSNPTSTPYPTPTIGPSISPIPTSTPFPTLVISPTIPGGISPTINITPTHP